MQGVWGSQQYDLATSHGANSSQVEGLVSSSLVAQGFQRQVPARVGLAEFRADFGLISDNDGILVEIERGRTLDNNMDMIDFWKCHIHPTAHHLVLVVPIWYRTNRGVTQSFSRVCKRLHPMSEQGFETNVWSLCIVGY